MACIAFVRFQRNLPSPETVASSPPNVDQLIEQLEALATREEDESRSSPSASYRSLMRKCEDVLILCYTLGPSPVFPEDKAKQLGPLLEDAMITIHLYISDICERLETSNLNLGKVVRSGLQYLLDMDSPYRKLVDESGEPLGDSIDEYIATKDIQAFDKALVLDTYEPMYGVPLSRLTNVPSNHHWWDL